MIDELLIATVLLAAAAMISCLSVEHKQQIRLMARPWWLVVILFLPLAGPIAWFIAGRPANPRHPRTLPARPQAPDDDAEFLRTLGKHPPEADEDTGSH